MAEGAGWYFTDNGTGIGTWHSFVADSEGRNYQNIDPLSLGSSASPVTSSVAADINEEGVVVGNYTYYKDGVFNLQGFVAIPR